MPRREYIPQKSRDTTTSHDIPMCVYIHTYIIRLYEGKNKIRENSVWEDTLRVNN